MGSKAAHPLSSLQDHHKTVGQVARESGGHFATTVTGGMCESWVDGYVIRFRETCTVLEKTTSTTGVFLEAM